MSATDAGVGWYVYVLVSRRGTTYVGVALDVVARLAQHNGLAPGGARSTRAGRPWRIRCVYGPFDSRAAAQSVEYGVKRLRGEARFRAAHPRVRAWRRIALETRRGSSAL